LSRTAPVPPSPYRARPGQLHEYPRSCLS